MAEQAREKRFPWLATTAIGFIVGLLGAVLFFQGRYGTWAATTHAWRGDVVLSDRYDVVVTPRPDPQTVAFWLTNTSAQPVRVVGAQSSCSCVMATGLPLDFAPGASQSLQVRIQPRKTADPFRESIRIFTDRPGQSIISLTISADKATKTTSAPG